MSEYFIKFKTVEECSITIINRFLEIVPQAEKWDIKEQAEAISDFTQRLTRMGIVCVRHSDDSVPVPTFEITDIPCSD